MIAAFLTTLLSVKLIEEEYVSFERSSLTVHDPHAEEVWVGDPDPMMMMPLVFSVFFFFFPAGLVLYWLVNNVVSIAQQWYIMKRVNAGA